MTSVFDPSFDELDENPIRCQSCNVPLVNHLGLFGTCAELIEARKRCEELAAKVFERGVIILQLSDNLIVKDVEIRKLKEGEDQ
jgi:hypothetical protein